MHIEKYHASLNDFIVVEQDNFNFDTSITKLTDRHAGVGADGLIIYNHKTKAVKFYNCDGSTANLCLNGLRCLSLFVVRNYGVNEEIIFKIDELYYKASIKSLDPFKVKIKLGENRFVIKEINDYQQLSSYPIGLVDIANKHTIIISNEFNDEMIKKVLKYDEFQNSNINLIKILDKNTIRIKTYERGVGFTTSCGSGSFASVLFLNSISLVDEIVTVKNDFDTFIINLNDKSIKGNAYFVCEVEYDV